MPLDKQPFDIDLALQRIRHAVAPFPKAALFELAEDGFNSVFEQLLACLISIRTRDEVTRLVARRLFQLARTPQAVNRLSVQQVEAAIRGTTFPEPKAVQILAIARRVVDEFAGDLPCDFETLTSLHGIGPKCANLVLSIACDQPSIAVDIHVHRVTNRWGYVQTRTPQKTLAALEKVLPPRHWVDINRLLVPFGKHICTGPRPKCSTCPVLEMCQQVGVTQPR